MQRKTWADWVMVLALIITIFSLVEGSQYAAMAMQPPVIYGFILAYPVCCQFSESMAIYLNEPPRLSEG